MKKLVIISAIIILAAVLLAGCGSGSIEGRVESVEQDGLQSAVKDHEHMTNEESMSALPALIASFSSLAEFTDASFDSKNSEDVADLTSLDFFYLPAGIPEDYILYKVNAGKKDIGFYYLPAEIASDKDAARFAEAEGRHFQFISSRGYYLFESLMDQFDVTSEDLVEGKYIVHDVTTTMVIWEEEGTVLMLYLPKGYVIDDWDTLFSTEKYVRSNGNSFKKAG